MMAMRGRWAEAVELFMAVSWLRVGSGGQGVIGRRCGRCGLGRCCDQRRGDRPGIEWARSGDGAAGRRTDVAGVLGERPGGHAWCDAPGFALAQVRGDVDPAPGPMGAAACRERVDTYV